MQQDEMSCFQDSEASTDDEFIDLADCPQVTKHWFQNCNMIEKGKDVSED